MHIFKVSGYSRFFLPGILSLLPIISGFSSASDTIRIGLLVTESKLGAAEKAASMAVNKANREKNGLFFILEKKVMEGPWGTGSVKAVDLVFNDNVCAILVSADGRNTHLAEMVSAKTRVPMVSALSGDPALTGAFVPWFFNCAFSSSSQSEAALKLIAAQPYEKKIIILSDDGYESRTASKNMSSRFRLAGKDITEINYDNIGINSIINQLNKVNPGCIILAGDQAGILTDINGLNKLTVKAQVILSCFPLTEKEIPEAAYKNFPDLSFISPCQPGNPAAAAFSREFEYLYGYKPGCIAALAYDGMNIIINSLKKAGKEQPALKKSLASTDYNGVSGHIVFDANGNRTGTIPVMKLSGGRVLTQRMP